jgi:hypothetical protein
MINEYRPLDSKDPHMSSEMNEGNKTVSATKTTHHLESMDSALMNKELPLLA